MVVSMDTIPSKLLLDTLNLIVISLNSEGIVTFANPFGENLLKGEQGPSPIGQDFFLRYLPKAEQATMRDYFEKLCSGETDRLHGIVSTLLVPKDGEKRIRWTAIAYKNPTGSPTGYIAYGMDITEARLLQEELEKTAVKYRTLFNQMPEPAWLVDAQSTKFLDVNDASLKLYGYTKEEFLNIHIADIDIFDDEAQVKKNAEQIKKEGFVAFETKHRTKTGNILDILVSVQPIMTPGETPVLSVTCHNLTRLKEKERDLRQLNMELEAKVEKRTQALENANQRLELAQRISHIGNWSRNMHDNKIEWSNEVFHIFGIPKSDDNRIDYDTFQKEIHPDDRQRIAKEVREHLQNEESSYGLDYKIKSGDGTLKYLHEEVMVISKENVVVRLEGTVQNVTERVRTEKELQEYNDILDTNIIASQTDLNGVITHASKAFCDISGYAKEELIGQKHNIVRHEDMPDEIYTELWQTILAGKAWEGELKNRKKDGTAYWVKAHITPKYNDEGVMTGFTAIRQDITDKKRIEELSITDELTGLYNRRYFNTVLGSAFHRAKRDGKVFCFFIMDVDHFKQYNDTYGHFKGDETLKSIARIFKEHFKRFDDSGYRLGGEEFGGLFIAENRDQALAFTEQFKDAIEAEHILHESSDISPYVTVSIGLLTIDFIQGNRTMEFESDRIYKQADDLLYQAKASGRNRVITARWQT